MTREEFKSNRKKLKFTQEALGNELGISTRTVIGYEAGTAKIPKAISVFLKQLVEKDRKDIKNVTVIDVSDKNSLTMKDIAKICIENKELFEKEPEIEIWFDLIRNEARAELMEKHVILRGTEK